MPAVVYGRMQVESFHRSNLIRFGYCLSLESLGVKTPSYFESMRPSAFWKHISDFPKLIVENFLRGKSSMMEWNYL